MNTVDFFFPQEMGMSGTAGVITIELYRAKWAWLDGLNHLQSLEQIVETYTF